MRWPVERYKEDWNLTAGNKFGQQISANYWHEGVDLNKNGGGDIELGKDIFAISNGELVYWHGGKHPTTGFGYHSVYKITGVWGTRWIHQAHCLPDITPAVKAVSENEVIGHVGKSGTTYAHIHFACFKVDPATLPQGIDTIAKTQQQLNDWWEDPILFIRTNMQPIIPPVNDLQKQLDEMRKQRDDNHNLYQAELAKYNTLRREFDIFKIATAGEINDLKTKLNEIKKIAS